LHGLIIRENKAGSCLAKAAKWLTPGMDRKSEMSEKNIGGKRPGVEQMLHSRLNVIDYVFS
jgi:hypothetical protein